MKHYTRRERERGELAARDLSPKAWRAYCESDPLTIYERETDSGTLYDVRGLIDGGGLTFDELQKALEEYADAVGDDQRRAKK